MLRNRLHVIIAATALAALSGIQPSAAGTPTQVSVQCASTDRTPDISPGVAYTTCFGDATYSFQSDGIPTAYGLKITAPSTHCSSVNYQVYATYDRNRLLGRTRNFLAAGQSEIVPIGNDYARGLQVVAIRALGITGGCNQGSMSGWGALVELVVIP